MEDDAALGKQLVASLSREGFDVTWWSVGQAPEPGAFDVVVVDLNLPGLSGFEVLEAVRSHDGVPVLVLSARSDSESKVKALRLGADDYMTKPFWPEELVERLKARLRRPFLAPPDRVMELGPLRLRLGDPRLEVRGETVHLTPSELAILTALARRPGMAVTRASLSELLDGEEGGRGLDVQISRLRKKLGDPDLVATVWGVGYRLGVETP